MPKPIARPSGEPEAGRVGVACRPVYTRSMRAIAVVVCAALGCGGKVVEIVSLDASPSISSSGVVAGGSGSGSGGEGPSSSSSGSSSGATCACPGGCCDTTNTCYAGIIDQLCGQSGGACTDCTASGQLCSGGTCVLNPSVTCIGDDPSACQTSCVSFQSACCKGYGGACGCVLIGTSTCQ